MAKPLTYLRQRANSNWLIGGDSKEFERQAEQRSQELKPLTELGSLPRILLAERNPTEFLASFMAACIAGCPVFLGNPDWADAEWQTVLDLVQPDLIWSDRSYPSSPDFNVSRTEGSQPIAIRERVPVEKGWIMIPTGGSSGQIRFAIHTWATMMASVSGFQRYFQIDRVNSCCVLPLYHVSGLMQFLRSFTSGGTLAVLPFKSLTADVRSGFDPSTFFLSLVPTQLQRSLQDPEAIKWLRQFQTVLLGGAPAWAELLEQARQCEIRLAPTYGMTETASQIATLKPDAFLKGYSNVGQVLPHARVTICDSTGQLVGCNQVGRITIKADSLALGYYPEGLNKQSFFQPDDLGFFDEHDRLHIVGRNSSKIITGGENVFPEEVEAAIRATQLVDDVCVVGLPDRQWGEAVTAVYVPKDSHVSLNRLQTKLSGNLSKFKHPKYWVAVKAMPRNAQGKINRELLKQQLKATPSNCSTACPTDQATASHSAAERL